MFREGGEFSHLYQRQPLKGWKVVRRASPAFHGASYSCLTSLLLAFARTNLCYLYNGPPLDSGGRKGDTCTAEMLRQFHVNPSVGFSLDRGRR